MSATLTQSLLQFVLWFAIASIVGSASYISFFLLRGNVQSLVLLVSSFATFCIFFSVLPLPSLQVVLCSTAMFGVSYLQGSAERSLVTKGKPRVIDILLSFQSIVYSLLIGSFLGYNYFQYYWGKWGYIGWAFGLCATSPAISFFRWMLHNSKLRPGIDRHLNDGDESM